jgi:hypothetical protein
VERGSAGLRERVGSAHARLSSANLVRNADEALQVLPARNEDGDQSEQYGNHDEDSECSHCVLPCITESCHVDEQRLSIGRRADRLLDRGALEFGDPPARLAPDQRLANGIGFLQVLSEHRLEVYLRYPSLNKPAIEHDEGPGSFGSLLCTPCADRSARVQACAGFTSAPPTVRGSRWQAQGITYLADEGIAQLGPLEDGIVDWARRVDECGRRHDCTALTPEREAALNSGLTRGSVVREGGFEPGATHARPA